MNKISGVIIVIIFLICLSFLNNKLLLEIYAISEPFFDIEITDDVTDYINMSTKEITTGGFRPTDLTSVNYYSNEKILNATLWLLFPFKEKPLMFNEVDYGIFIDADFDKNTGFGGIDYNIAIQWNKTKNTWEYLIEQWSLYGEGKIIDNQSNYSNFFEKNQKYVSLSLDLGKIHNPEKFKVLFYADSRKNKDGPLITDFSRWVAIPPLELSLSTKPNYIELSRGEQKNIEVIINSTQGYEPTVNLYTTNKSKEINFDFPYNQIRIPSFGVAYSTINVIVDKNAKLGPQTLFIFANSSFPPDELIKPKVNIPNYLSNYRSSIPTENIITQSSISVSIKKEPSIFDKVNIFWNKIGGVAQFISGIIIGISPWIYNQIRNLLNKSKQKNNDYTLDNYKPNSLVTAKSLGITIFLSIIVFGLGQIYLGYRKRGIAILIIGYLIVLSLVLSSSSPIIVFVILTVFIYWIWQIIDSFFLSNLYKKRKKISQH
jgi:hypothetical protein